MAKSSTRRAIRTVAIVSALTVTSFALAACTPDPVVTPTARPSTTPPPQTISPAPTSTERSVGPLVSTKLTAAQGTDPGAAKGQSLDIPQGWSAEVWADVPGARLATWSPDGRLIVSSASQGTVT